MEYYLYISDAKVDMLLPQVPHELKKKVALEFKLDLKLLSASRKSETEVENDRIARLEAVVNFIREFSSLGSVNAPEEYVEDTMPMRWGPYDWDADSPLVYFGGVTDSIIVGLGGSAKHVLGSTGSSHAHSHSLTPVLTHFLKKQLGIDSDKEHGSAEDPDGSLFAVELASTQMEGPTQRLHFVAKRLLHGDVSGRKVLLGTPLYVAMAE
jgi:hypothetical protein